PRTGTAGHSPPPSSHPADPGAALERPLSSRDEARHPYALFSVLRRPGTHTRDPLHPDVSNEPGRRVVHGREADTSTEVGVSEFLQKLGGASLGDAGSAVDDEVLVQADGGAVAGFDGERDTAVVADVAHLAMLGKVTCHELVAVETDP